MITKIRNHIFPHEIEEQRLIMKTAKSLRILCEDGDSSNLHIDWQHLSLIWLVSYTDVRGISIDWTNKEDAIKIVNDAADLTIKLIKSDAYSDNFEEVESILDENLFYTRILIARSSL